MWRKILQSRHADYLDFIRLKMVEEQVMRRGVTDTRVLAALRKVKRHLFVPDGLISTAYDDHPLPIACGQTVSQPYIVGLMSQLLALKGGERVLEIGTGSGYQTAVLAELAAEVYTVEFFGELSRQAAAKTAKLGYTDIKFMVGDGTSGWREEGPYDAIIVTCAPAAVPGELPAQLKEGGRLVIPVGQEPQLLKLITKTPAGLEEREICSVRFVPMLKGPNEHSGL
jgi:protein-L-isoaspartate(D-aspartate) O-methyltransferase